MTASHTTLLTGQVNSISVAALPALPPLVLLQGLVISSLAGTSVVWDDLGTVFLSFYLCEAEISLFLGMGESP